MENNNNNYDYDDETNTNALIFSLIRSTLRYLLPGYINLCSIWLLFLDKSDIYGFLALVTNAFRR